MSDLPLWRLIVALHDAEYVAGPDSDTVDLIRLALEEKLRALRQPAARRGQAVPRG